MKFNFEYITIKIRKEDMHYLDGYFDLFFRIKNFNLISHLYIEKNKYINSEEKFRNLIVLLKILQ